MPRKRASSSSTFTEASSKMPWMKWYAGDWLKDPQLSMCSPTTRAVWFDLLCAMHELDQCGQVSGTRDQLARAGRCATSEFNVALAELVARRIAEVSGHESTNCNAVVTIVNRRMKRDYDSRENTRKRVEKHRKLKRGDGEEPPCNASVTQQRSEVRGQKSEVRTPSPNGGGNDAGGRASSRHPNTPEGRPAWELATR
jgi:hypothetical protein